MEHPHLLERSPAPRSNARLHAVLLAGLMLAPGAEWKVPAMQSPKVDTFSYGVGTQTIGSKYRFTGDTVLVETAKAILAMGSNVFKISLAKDFHRHYPGIPANESIRSLVDLARDEPSFRAVLDMPFGHYLLWVYPFHAGWWADGLTAEESKAEYEEMRAFVRYLLTRYNGSGKTFLLGHWEGDWYLHANYDPAKDPSPQLLQGMIDWLNVRQKAVDDAKRETPHRGVQVYHYTEVNLVQKAMQGGKTLTNNVLPHTSVDFVSYSSYDSLGAEGDALRLRLQKALDYVESKLPPKPGIMEKRVFIGEYGFPAVHHTAERQKEQSRTVMRAALEWGCPYVLYWEMYCNEVGKDGKHRGFWLIDDKGVKQPVYHLHEEFLREARRFVAEFHKKHRRLPTAAEYREQAPRLLDGVK